MPAYSTLSQGSFGLATALTGYLAYRSVQPPNARRKDENESVLDSIGGDRLFLTAALYRLIFLTVPLWQGLVSYNRGLAPATDPRFPMNDMFFHWNKVSAATFAIIWTGSILRLRSYSELGKNFTYDLHEPDELNTRGLYQYVQHPSYTGMMAALSGAGFWFFRVNGVLATILPESILQHQKWLNIVLPSIPFCLGSIMIPRRVKDEEVMMRKKFGKQWEEWHARTARYIPFLI